MKRYLLGALLGVAAMFGGAGASDAVELNCPKSPMRVVILGDSLADGLWMSINGTFAQCDTMSVVRLTKVSDGLAKSSGQDWIQRYLHRAGAPSDKTSDIVIVQIGANDITAIRNGRTRESFNTDIWNALYAQRVSEITNTLGAHATEFYWLGLPVVGNTDYEPAYQIISALQADAVKKAGGTFIDIHELTKFGTGDFSMAGKIGGQLMQLRAPDKVHFTKPGYDYVASVVLDDVARVIANHNRRIALQDVQLQ